MTAIHEHYYALIMAGGGGTRLWPLSRKSHPKQMLPLIDDQQSMFQLTVRRLQPLLPPERIFVVTGPEMAPKLQADVPEIPIANYVIEPFGRNSGPAAALGTMAITERDPDAVIAALSADHYIANTERFRDVLAAAAELAASKTMIVTLGVSPSRPAIEFGYIKRGHPLGQIGGFDCYRAAGFTEKPGIETALKFVSSGLYSWNSGMFIYKADQILGELARQQPDMLARLQTIGAAIDRDDYTAVLDEVWPAMTRLSLDYAVMEGAENVAVIPVDIGWSDIGSWATLLEVLAGDLNGNVSRGHAQQHLKIDTCETLIVSDRMVVTIGIEDIVIVDTDDVLLVCHRDRSQDVRDVVSLLRDAGDTAHL